MTRAGTAQGLSNGNSNFPNQGTGHRLGGHERVEHAGDQTPGRAYHSKNDARRPDRQLYSSRNDTRLVRAAPPSTDLNYLGSILKAAKNLWHLPVRKSGKFVIADVRDVRDFGKYLDDCSLPLKQKDRLGGLFFSIFFYLITCGVKVLLFNPRLPRH